MKGSSLTKRQLFPAWDLGSTLNCSILLMILASISSNIKIKTAFFSFLPIRIIKIGTSTEIRTPLWWSEFLTSKSKCNALVLNDAWIVWMVGLNDGLKKIIYFPGLPGRACCGDKYESWRLHLCRMQRSLQQKHHRRTRSCSSNPKIKSNTEHFVLKYNALAKWQTAGN